MSHYLIEKYVDALNSLDSSLQYDDIDDIVTRLKNCSGKLIWAGLGKSGHICKKVSASLSSTGRPSIFLHASEACHGDMGMMQQQDVVVLVSWSGISDELTNIQNYCINKGIDNILITANDQSPLLKYANYKILLPEIEEACPLGLAPTTSSMLILTIGDLLMVKLQGVINFQKEDFAHRHPNGRLGLRLKKLAELNDVYLSFAEVVNYKKNMKEVISKMTKGGRGVVAVIDDSESLIGVFTDGDLRRSLDKFNLDSLVHDFMTPNPIIVSLDQTLEEIKEIMIEKKIPSLFSYDINNKLRVIHLYDILRMGL